jgi:hypothetical protein
VGGLGVDRDFTFACATERWTRIRDFEFWSSLHLAFCLAEGAGMEVQARGRERAHLGHRVARRSC